jgi:F-type H+-transporting ATPase subunit a
MQDHNLLTGHQWQPFTQYGLTHKFWTLNTDTLLSSAIITVFIILFSLYAYYVLQKKQSISKFIILKYVEACKELLNQTLQSTPLNHLAFIGSLFVFIFLCNTISLVPFLEEPTKDLNTTLALGLISFFYVQGHALYHKGLKHY